MSDKDKNIWKKIPINMQNEILTALTNICLEIAYEQEYIYNKRSFQQKSDYLYSSINDATSINS